MQYLTDFLVSFSIALAFSAVLVALIGWQLPQRPRARSSMLFAFPLLLFAVWAGGIWLQPLGPTLWGITWAPFLIVGLFVALIMVVLIPPSPPKTRQQAIHQARSEQGARKLLTAFFWMFLILLIIAVAFRYVQYVG